MCSILNDQTGTEAKTEQFALHEVVNILSKISEIKVLAYRLAPIESDSKQKYSTDFQITIKIKNEVIDLNCNYNKSGYPSRIAHKILQLGMNLSSGSITVIVAPYFSPETVKMVDKADIGVIDLSGNYSFKVNSKVFQITNNRNLYDKNQNMKKNFLSKAEVKLLSFIKNHPDQEFTILNLAAACIVSYGQTWNIVQEMLKKQIFVKHNGKIELNDLNMLLEILNEEADS